MEQGMEQEQLPEWEGRMVDEMLEQAQERLERESSGARRRAVQLAREQAYHRLAAAIDRPGRSRATKGQLSLFPTDPTLFDDAG
ncbi:MAG TPA: hypothetical protein VE712_04040 [Actinomycetota bacterium]|jgi:hypothetical protein|nr:hypothetical protein [Actinomycetota bacterium]